MYVHTPTESLLLRVRDPFAIRELMPSESRTVQLPDGHNIAVKWTLDSAKLLNNIGIAAPSPIKSFYNFPRPPHYQLLDHQVEMASFATLHDKMFNLSEPGTGKTAATLWAADFLMNLGVIKRALIIPPIGPMKSTWAPDIFNVLPHRTFTVIHGDAKRRMKNLSLPVDFYILNHDGVDIEAVAKEVRRRADIDLIVVDEADEFRNARIDKYRFLAWIMERKKRLWMLTGTPCPNWPDDAWALSKLVCPHLSPKYFGMFRDEVRTKVTEHKWRVLEGGAERAFEIMQPAIRFKKRDVLKDLPPLVGPRDVRTTLSKEQLTAVKAMRDEMTMFAAGRQINAVNGADKIIKLRQIFAGSVKDPKTGLYHHLDCTQRINDLVHEIARSVGKVLVIVPFTGILQLLEQELPKHGYRVLSLSGAVKINKRPGIISEFKENSEIDVMLAHPKVMSHGINLTEVSDTIFYAPINSNVQYMQVIERNSRLGQVNTMWLKRMLAHPIEASLYKVLDDRGSTQNGILELYQQFIDQKDDTL